MAFPNSIAASPIRVARSTPLARAAEPPHVPESSMQLPRSRGGSATQLGGSGVNPLAAQPGQAAGDDAPRLARGGMLGSLMPPARVPPRAHRKKARRRQAVRREEPPWLSSSPPRPRGLSRARRRRARVATDGSYHGPPEVVAAMREDQLRRVVERRITTAAQTSNTYRMVSAGGGGGGMVATHPLPRLGVAEFPPRAFDNSSLDGTASLELPSLWDGGSGSLVGSDAGSLLGSGSLVSLGLGHGGTATRGARSRYGGPHAATVASVRAMSNLRGIRPRLATMVRRGCCGSAVLARACAALIRLPGRRCAAGSW